MKKSKECYFSRWGPNIIHEYGKFHAHIETILEYYRNVYLHELLITSTHRLALYRKDGGCTGQTVHFYTQVGSPAVSEEALGLGGRAVLAVVEIIVPEGTTSVVSVDMCAKRIM